MMKGLTLTLDSNFEYRCASIFPPFTALDRHHNALARVGRIPGHGLGV